MGYSGLLIDKISDPDKGTRTNEKDLEFYWQPDFVVPDDNSETISEEGLFTHIMYNNFEVPCSALVI